MSRHRRARGRAHEHVITQHLVLTCPREPAHRLVSVSGDMVKISIGPAVDKGAGTVNAPDVPLRQDGDRLRVSCPSCARTGRVRNGGDEQVRLDTVLAIVAVMREHGPASLRLPFDGAALKNFLRLHPVAAASPLPPATVRGQRTCRAGESPDGGPSGDVVERLRAVVSRRRDTPG